jgi:predicted alpha/beta hydrolase family esterase
MKKQIIVIHGGSVFDTYKEYIDFLKKYKLDFKKLKLKLWKENLPNRLGNGFEVISPRMPNSMNAKYKEWKIMFEKLFPFFKNNLILLGHSLGGIFLAKYLSENKFPRKIKATFLVAAPYDDKTTKDSLGDFKLPKKLDKFQKQGGKIFLYQSKDDLSVSLVDLKKYKKSLPEAEVVMFRKKGHFNQVEFPEIVKDIKRLK